jgi:hypothetical protein
MGVWGHLLSSIEGQMSLAVLAGLVGMGIWFGWYFNKKVRESDAQKDEQQK